MSHPLNLIYLIKSVIFGEHNLALFALGAETNVATIVWPIAAAGPHFQELCYLVQGKPFFAVVLRIFLTVVLGIGKTHKECVDAGIEIDDSLLDVFFVKAGSEAGGIGSAGAQVHGCLHYNSIHHELHEVGLGKDLLCFAHLFLLFSGSESVKVKRIGKVTIRR